MASSRTAENLRDIEARLRSRVKLLEAMGARGFISKNKIADASRWRHWRVYFELDGPLLPKRVFL